MTDVILNNLPLWTSAVKQKSTAGRGSRSKLELTGIKKLRELILELAVRGQLVPQDPNDEPASELLKRIAEEKAELIKAGRLKKQKPLPEITEDEKPFALPQGWEWVRFGEVIDFQGGSQPPKSRFIDEPMDGYVQLIQIRDLGPSPQPIYVPENSVSKFCTQDDILVGRYGASVGKVFWGKNGAYNVALIKLIFSDKSLDRCFVYLLMNAPIGQSLFSGISRSAQDGFSKSDIEDKLIPLLPLNEQQRIVAKVDELMALCDQLEQQTENQLSAHQQLVETLLATLTNTQSSDELADNWARLAEHFDLLFSGPMGSWAVDRLKDTILQLAVQGKLVPQDPADEPAAQLLARIAEEKAALIKAGKLKKQKPLPPITDDEKPFELPRGWEWVRLGDVSKITAGNSFKSEDFSTDESGIKVIKITNAGVGEFVETREFLPISFSNLYKDFLVSEGDFILALTRPFISDGLKISRCPKSYHNSLLNQRVASIKLNSLLCNDYFYYYFRSNLVLDVYVERFGSSGLQPNLKMSDVSDLVFSAPPLNEQNRIVEKVDQLFELCDQLKAKLEAANTTQLQLTEAVVEHSLMRH